MYGERETPVGLLALWRPSLIYRVYRSSCCKGQHCSNRSMLAAAHYPQGDTARFTAGFVVGSLLSAMPSV
jgi:hypothetical protein